MFKTDVGLKCLHVTTVIIYCMKIFHTKAYTSSLEQNMKSTSNNCINRTHKHMQFCKVVKKCGGDF